MERETSSKKIGLLQKLFTKQNKRKKVLYGENKNSDFIEEITYHRPKKSKNEKGEPTWVIRSKSNVSRAKNVVKKSNNKKAKNVIKVIIKNKSCFKNVYWFFVVFGYGIKFETTLLVEIYFSDLNCTSFS